jgi:tripartite-type tricarboxylate transporter receptor subunit TctC
MEPTGRRVAPPDNKLSEIRVDDPALRHSLSKTGVKRPYGFMRATKEDIMKRLCAMLLLTLLVGPAMRPTSAAAQTQNWPTRPVRIVNTFAAGGAADLLARTVADGLASAFGQPFIVETRAGAGGAIGVQSVAATAPDGYNFVITNVSILVLAPISNPRLGYGLRDLSNIAYIAGSPLVLDRKSVV